jgi:glycerol-3-phosphate dehydrogenase
VEETYHARRTDDEPLESPRPLAPRASRLAALDRPDLDVLVVGGGITGGGLALDLALRGLSVALVERGDWASATSSASSRLVHGGLRYLEQLELGLVRESCLERGLLLRNAAGLVWPERFTFPVHRGGPVGRAKLVAGLLLYTAVSVPRVLGLPRPLSAGGVRRALPQVRAAGLAGGASYLDAATHDARLALAVVLTAIEAGASAVSRVEATAIENGASGVAAALLDGLSGERREVRARACVLAGGPFTDRLRFLAGLARPAPSGRTSASGTGRWVAPTRGTHLVVPRERLPTDGAVIFNSSVDGRVLFLIPWPRATVIGTTDLDASPDAPPRATRGEVRYLLESANALAPAAELGEADVIATYAGLRPLLAADRASPSARSREERVEREGSIYTIAGGKLTGYRAMAESLGARIASDLGKGDASRHSPTRTRALRGALASPVPRPAWSSLAARPARDALWAAAWTRRYGALAPLVTEVCARVPDGREALDDDTLLGEVDFAARFEDALSASDFVFRRSDLAFGEPRERTRLSDAVLQRFADLAAWSPERLVRERAELERDFERMEAWRRDPA